MDFSNLKLEVYDFLGVLIPGLIAICEGWIVLTGWTAFTLHINQLSGVGLTLLAIVAFGVGNLVQELGDMLIKTLKGQRYFRRSRDKFWNTHNAEVVRAAIRKELGSEITDVDAAFNYCLTKLGDRFKKRDLFIATSDLSRSLAVLSILAIAPVARIIWDANTPIRRHVVVFGISIAFLVFLAFLSWRRMVRFRELSEITVFSAYLATIKESGKT